MRKAARQRARAKTVIERFSAWLVLLFFAVSFWPTAALSATPTATVVVANPSLVSGDTSLVTITFSEAVDGFANEDLTVSNATLSNVSSSDGGITWTATLNPASVGSSANNVITLIMNGLMASPATPLKEPSIRIHIRSTPHP